jgi:hypothetical protein
MTNFIQTDQSRSECSESITIPEAHCKTDEDCKNRPYMSNINGRWTGRCLLSPDVYGFNGTYNTTQNPPGLCEIQGKVKKDFIMLRNNSIMTSEPEAIVVFLYNSL